MSGHARHWRVAHRDLKPENATDEERAALEARRRALRSAQEALRTSRLCGDPELRPRLQARARLVLELVEEGPERSVLEAELGPAPLARPEPPSAAARVQAKRRAGQLGAQPVLAADLTSKLF